MMRRIEAEERLAAIRDRAAAAGTLPRGEGMRHFRELQRTAQAAGGGRAAKATPAALAGMGIGVRTVSAPAEKAPSDG